MQHSNHLNLLRRQLLYIGLLLLPCINSHAKDHTWSEQDIAFLSTFWIKNLAPLNADKSNRIADSKPAAKLGKKLFFDKRLSINNEVSCASCHDPKQYFTDGLTTAVGVSQTKRNTPTIIGSAYNSWYFWDGRKDSQWAQALGPLEDAAEHGATRTYYSKIIVQHYKEDYEALFGKLDNFLDEQRFPQQAGPHADRDGQSLWKEMSTQDQLAVNTVYSNIGKSIAAYERLILPTPSRFDAYVEAVIKGKKRKQKRLFKKKEVAGLKLFLGKANCTQCHTGPLFTNHAFHNIGLPPESLEAVELGRIITVDQVIHDEFNCKSNYSDSPDCPELDYVKRTGFELIGAFKTPTLRNIAKTAPYTHRGIFKTLKEVLTHYNSAPIPYYDPKQHSERPHSDLLPLKLSEKELSQLEAFLHTLTGKIPNPDI